MRSCNWLQADMFSSSTAPLYEANASFKTLNKNRFITCTLPAWTWLPLTPLQATIFGWSELLNNPGHFEGQDTVLEREEQGEEGFPAVLPDGVSSRPVCV